MSQDVCFPFVVLIVVQLLLTSLVGWSLGCWVSSTCCWAAVCPHLGQGLARAKCGVTPQKRQRCAASRGTRLRSGLAPKQIFGLPGGSFVEKGNGVLLQACCNANGFAWDREIRKLSPAYFDASIKRLERLVTQDSCMEHILLGILFAITAKLLV